METEILINSEVAPKATRVALAAVSSHGAVNNCKRYLSEGDRDVFTGRGFGVDYQIEPNNVTIAHLEAVRQLGMRRNIFPDEQAEAFAKVTSVSETLCLITDTPLREMPDYIAHGVEHSSKSVTCCAWKAADALWYELPRVAQFGGLVSRSKLLARLRPDTFPVYDGVVGTALGIGDGRRLRYSIWGTFQAVVQDSNVWEYLVQIRDQINYDLKGNPYLEGVTPLRVLDIVLWMDFRRHLYVK